MRESRRVPRFSARSAENRTRILPMRQSLTAAVSVEKPVLRYGEPMFRTVAVAVACSFPLGARGRALEMGSGARAVDLYVGGGHQRE